MSSLDKRVAGIGFATTSLIGAETVEAAEENFTVVEQRPLDPTRINSFDLDPKVEAIGGAIALIVLYKVGKVLAGEFDEVRKYLSGAVLVACAITLGAESAEAAEPRPVGDSNHAEAFMILGTAILIGGSIANIVQRSSSTNKTTQKTTTNTGVKAMSPREERLYYEGIESGEFFDTAKDELAGMKKK